MKITKIENRQTFGIRCINPKSWNSEFLKNFEKSKLVKEIDAKYPNASANYFSFKQNDMVNDEDVWTTLFDIILTPNKIWHYHLDSHNFNVPNQHLQEQIDKMGVSDLEVEIGKQAKTGVVPYRVKMTIQKTNPIKESSARIIKLVQPQKHILQDLSCIHRAQNRTYSPANQYEPFRLTILRRRNVRQVRS